MDTLQFSQFAKANYFIVYCNDGSSDATKDIIETEARLHNNIMAISSNQNLGKGNILQYSYEELVKQEVLQDGDWIGFWDADLATPLDEVNNFLQYGMLYNQEVNSIFGSRVYRLGAKIFRQAHRHYISRIFATLFHLFLKIETYDSQCGAKIFSYKAAKIAFVKPFMTRWLFDLEILLRLEQKEIIEYPLQTWTSVEGSKINFKENFRILFELAKLVLFKTQTRK